MFTLICGTGAVLLWLLSIGQVFLLLASSYALYKYLNVEDGSLFKNVLTTFTLVLVNFHIQLRQACRGSYGYYSKRVGLLSILISSVISFAYFLYFSMYLVLEFSGSSSLHTLIGSVSFFLLWLQFTIQYYKASYHTFKIYEFVDSVVKANNDNGIPLDESAARDLYKIRESEHLFLRSVDSTHSFRLFGDLPLEHAEFHFLCRVVDALDRIALNPQNPYPIRALGDEIRARCSRFNLSSKNKRGYLSLAKNFPRIVEPPSDDPYYEYDRRVAVSNNSYGANSKTNIWSGSRHTLL
ncbi:hypothetical protein M3Y98_00914800 [Aphelenchoides besseyi]|nr:hypothetical protein M3Y98_00914800 [Aphelenchoides besseyi]KAI6193504.1 hypothetical protein M3Y96_01024700 [Aphelenchoides besseyi]